MNLWNGNGGDPTKAYMASAIALAESGGNVHAVNKNTDGSIDRGTWQINSVHGPLSTFDANANAKAAIKLSDNGKNWHPWSTFNNGAYKKFFGSHDPLANAMTSVGNTVSGVVGAATAIPDFLGKLGVVFDGSWWLRVGQILLGIAAILFGVNFFAKEFTGVNPAKMAATAAVI